MALVAIARRLKFPMLEAPQGISMGSLNCPANPFYFMGTGDRP